MISLFAYATLIYISLCLGTEWLNHVSQGRVVQSPIKLTQDSFLYIFGEVFCLYNCLAISFEHE